MRVPALVLVGLVACGGTVATEHPGGATASCMDNCNAACGTDEACRAECASVCVTSASSTTTARSTSSESQIKGSTVTLSGGESATGGSSTSTVCSVPSDGCVLCDGAWQCRMNGTTSTTPVCGAIQPGEACIAPQTCIMSIGAGKCRVWFCKPSPPHGVIWSPTGYTDQCSG
jgi:hypothetical protein